MRFSEVQDTRRTGLGWLYGANTLGAVVGTLFANFWALAELGTRSTLWIACAINLIAVALAYRLGSRFRSSVVRDALPIESADKKPARNRPRETSDEVPHHMLVYVMCGLVGFIFFSMELVWFRMLGPLLGGTTYTFGLILAVALIGIGVGSFLYALWSKHRTPTLMTLSLTCLSEAVALGMPLYLGDQIAFWTNDLQGVAKTFDAHVVHWSLIAGVVVLPASLIAGFQFPLLLGLLGRGRDGVGQHVGIASGINTLGAVLGSIGTGFILLPMFGAVLFWKLNVLLLASSAIVIALLGFRQQGAVKRSLSTWAPRLVATVLFVFLVVELTATGPTAVWRHAEIGAGRSQLPPHASAATREDWASFRRRSVIEEYEGREASVALTAIDAWSFVINGKTDGNAVGDAGTQIMLGLLGGMLHPNPRKAAVVGLGTGETAGWLAEAPGMQQVEVIEIEPNLIEVAKRCSSVNREVLKNPKVSLKVADARERLLTASSKYDLIISEPSNPYRAGIASLFTQEFYHACRDSLAENGIFVQWLQAYEVDWETVLTVLKTLRSEFESVEIWQSQGSDLLLICHAKPTEYSLTHLEQQLKHPVLQQGVFTAWKAQAIEDFFARCLINREGVDRLIAEFPLVNTDDLNLIEFGFARTLGKPTDFDLVKLSARAVDERVHLPEFKDGTLASETVCEFKQIMYGTALEQRYETKERSETHQRRERLLSDYWQGNFKSMLQLARQWEWEPMNHSERVLLASAAAFESHPLFDELISDIESLAPTDAMFLKSVRHHFQGENAAAVDQLVAACMALRQEPWLFSHLREAFSETVLMIAAQSPNRKLEIYRALSAPFDVRALEGDRVELLSKL